MVTFDLTNFTAVCDDVEKRQLPFATALALNRTAEEAQDRARLELHAKFAIRTPASAQFFERMIKIQRQDRATKENLVARLPITAGPNSDPSRVSVLTRHIDGGPRSMPGGPLSSFFIPSHATRPTPYTVVPRYLYPKNLRLMDRRDVDGMLYAKRHVTASGKVQLQGKRRTFVLTERGTGRPFGVFQREGPHEIQLLWFYTKQITLKPRYDFFGVARRTFLERFGTNFVGMWAYALRTAK